MAAETEVKAASRPGLRRIDVNGDTVETEARTVADLLVELGYGEAKVATALNGEFVPARRRDATSLAAGDRVEIVAPRQGG